MKRKKRGRTAAERSVMDPRTYELLEIVVRALARMWKKFVAKVESQQPRVWKPRKKS